MPNYQLTRKTVVTTKVEPAVGSDASPVASADTLLLYGDGNVLSTDTKAVDKQQLRASLTNGKDLIGRQLNSLKLSTCVMGKGASSGVVFYDPLLKACGFGVAAGGVAASSSWVYTPVSSSFTTASIYAYLESLLFKSFSCAGTFVANFVAGDAPMLDFTFQGTYNDPTAPGVPSPTYPTDTKVLVGSAGLSIGAYNAAAGLVARSIQLTWGASNAERGDVNSTAGFKGIKITNRAPTMQIVCEVVDDITTKNFHTYLNSGQAVADGSMDTITWQQGVAGAQSIQKFTVTAPQLKNVSFSDDQGVRLYTLDYKLRHNTDEGEFKWEQIEKN